jgi:hypothetical protein
MDAVPYSSAWNTPGAYFHDPASGYVWIRPFLRNNWLSTDITWTGTESEISGKNT